MVLLGASCGDNAAGPDALEDTRALGPLIELPLLEGYNHAAETCIAARDGRVVVAFINLDLEDESSFGSAAGPIFRRVGTIRSLDGGETFTSTQALASADTNTSDPVVRVDAQGVFWAVAIDVETDRARVWSSADGGATWSELAIDLPVEDKEWLAIDDQGDVLYVQGRAGIFQVDRQGTVIASASYDSRAGRNAAAGYVDQGEAYFLTLARRVIGWNGTGEPAQVGPQFYSGNMANTFTVGAGSIGVTPGGVHWLVRSVHDTSGSPVLLGLSDSPGGPYQELGLSPEDGVTFLPAADLDEQGRLHVVWYDSTGEQGVLRYTHSISADLTGGFLPALVVDSDACPGQGWYPYSASDPPPGGRRLREYIGIAVDGSRAHITWTHAPEPPSRVFATYVDF